ncbi:MAG: hypothetical protein DDT21_02609 [Syntrophomonadaceae bacterium]|nr:hypothetical protein [Bacillota bacterium]
MEITRKTIVISGVNLTNGGPLSIFKDCLAYASEGLIDRYDVVALVHDKALFDVRGIRFIEFPLSKKSWIFRLYYEWIRFGNLSSELKPFLWLSLHDMTPRVAAERRAVYCHNSSPFYKLKIGEAIVDPKFALFNKFYSLLYKINIEKNDWVIVQQEWMRKEFFLRYPVKKSVVAKPSIPATERAAFNGHKKPDHTIFIFPTFPRFFKNIEVIGEAAGLLMNAGYENFEVLITIDGTENRYARKMLNRFAGVSKIKFIGLQTRDRVFELYGAADCLIFPSKLETWGLPLSEFKLFNKPILAADLPYAHETMGQYGKVKFFDPGDAGQLAKDMMALMDGQLKFDMCNFAEPPQPFAAGWEALFEILLAQNGGCGRSSHAD